MINLLHEYGSLNKALILGVLMWVVHHKHLRMHCKAEAHVNHVLDVHHLVLKVPGEALIIPGHQGFGHQHIWLKPLQGKRKKRKVYAFQQS